MQKRAVQESAEVLLPEKLFQKRRTVAESHERVPGRRDQSSRAEQDCQIADAVAQEPERGDEEHERDQAFGEHGQAEKHTGEERPAC